MKMRISRQWLFFHMPVREFKEAYERMKLGDNDVIYKHGSVGEKNDHFGISRFKGIFFNSAVDNGVIKWMFCGHDHLNTLSLVYKRYTAYLWNVDRLPWIQGY